MTAIQKNTYLPIFRQVADDLRERIMSRELQAGQKLPPEPELASQLGIGRDTLRKSLRILASQGLVRQRRGKGTFVCALTITNEVRLRIGVVGIGAGRDTPDMHRSELFAGIEQGIQRWPETELLFMPGQEPGLATFRMGGLHGIFLSPSLSRVNADELRHLADLPHVVVCESFAVLKRAGCVYADTENYKVSIRAVNHLVELGHRHIVHLAGDRDRCNIRDRCRGYSRALQRNGLSNTEMIVDMTGLDAVACRRAFRDFLIAHPSCTAVYAGGPGLTMAALRVAHELGLRVPRDISVVGFDDGILLDEVVPPLTLVRQPTRELGRVAARMLLEQLDGRRLKRRHVVLESEFVVGESTGLVRQGDL